MTRYNEVEVQTAKNLLKEGFKWLDKKYSGAIYAYKNNPSKAYAPDDVVKIICSGDVPIFKSINFEDFPTSLESIVQILDDTEKRYLSSVIRPFRDKVDLIYKVDILGSYGFQRIAICLNDTSTDIVLPPFERESMYKGMKTGHGYTLEELGL